MGKPLELPKDTLICETEANFLELSEALGGLLRICDAASACSVSSSAIAQRIDLGRFTVVEW